MCLNLQGDYVEKWVIVQVSPHKHNFLITSRGMLIMYSYFPTDRGVNNVLMCSSAIGNTLSHIAFYGITHESFLST
jgi:hypothetical protein